MTGITNPTIPKTIHQTYPGGALDSIFSANISTLKSSNPDWSHKLYDSEAIEAFIADAYGLDMVAAYRRIDPLYGAARADLFRYLLIYDQGGVYLDLKSSFDGPIGNRIDTARDNFILSQWRNGPGEPHEGYGLKSGVDHVAGGEFQQWHVISAPKHPFLGSVILAVLRAIRDYRPWRSGTGKPGVLSVTGPIVYTRTIAPLTGAYPHRRLGNETEIGLVYSILPNDRHRTMLGAHYSSRKHPVITPKGPIQTAGFALHSATRQLRSIVAAR